MSARVMHSSVKVVSRRHGCGTVRNTMVAVLPVPSASRLEQFFVIQQEQKIAPASVWSMVRSVRSVTGNMDQRLSGACVGAAPDVWK